MTVNWFTGTRRRSRHVPRGSGRAGNRQPRNDATRQHEVTLSVTAFVESAGVFAYGPGSSAFQERILHKQSSVQGLPVV